MFQELGEGTDVIHGEAREALLRAMCGRLRVGKRNLHVAGRSVQPCVRPVSAVCMTAGHNALRGSGPGQKPAFDEKVARCDNQKPLRPTYPCEDCANLVPYYCNCRATWDDRQRAERERINAKQRERRARRREMKRPALCATCGAARTPASAFELSRRADGAW